MIPKLYILNNDRGSIMVVSLLLLVFLTIIGITATSNTRMELNMTRNSQEYKRDFYVADSGWRAAAADLTEFNWDYPDYPGGVKAFGNPDGTLNNIDYAYRIEHLTAEAGAITTVGAAGNSGSMDCRDEVFEVTSRALDADGESIQEITTRLVKVCCVLN
jgi:hypothetical protein